MIMDRIPDAMLQAVQGKTVVYQLLSVTDISSPPMGVQSAWSMKKARE